MEIAPEDKRKYCPVCLSKDDVRIAGKKGNIHQYLCKNCDTYFIPHTVFNEHKKIWHDKIKWKRIRHLEKWLGFGNRNNIKSAIEDNKKENKDANKKNKS